MSRKLLSLTCGLLLSAGLAGTALAAGPVKLSASQMDKVTAGWAFAYSDANAFAVGDRGAGIYTNTSAVALDGHHFSLAAGSSTSSAFAH
jgi:hypothetical protein